jgi:hypothetical protein
MATNLVLSVLVDRFQRQQVRRACRTDLVVVMVHSQVILSGKDLNKDQVGRI